MSTCADRPPRTWHVSLVLVLALAGLLLATPQATRAANGPGVEAGPAGCRHRVEAVFWTGEVAAAVADFAEVYRGQPAEVRELWTTGRVSERFAAETAAFGWTVRDRWQPPAG